MFDKIFRLRVLSPKTLSATCLRVLCEGDLSRVRLHAIEAVFVAVGSDRRRTAQRYEVLRTTRVVAIGDGGGVAMSIRSGSS